MHLVGNVVCVNAFCLESCLYKSEDAMCVAVCAGAGI